MMYTLLSLLACQTTTPDGGEPGDFSGTDTNLPAWSGTQIGEEGDILCAYEEADWDASAEAASPWDPDALPEGDWAGSFSATLPEEDADLQVTIAHSGEPRALVPPHGKEKECPIGVRQPVTLTFSAPPLLDVSVDGALSATEVVRLRAELDEDEVLGTLTPGRLPDDAGALVLEIFGIDGWSGGARWILERPSGLEESGAGDWDAQ